MIMTTKSGRWSDPTVWAGGAVPPAGEVAHIVSGHQIIYDMESDRILSDVMSDMGSKLTWDNTKDTRLRVNSLMLNGITELVDPAESATPGKPRHEIVYHPISGKDPGASDRLGGMFMGPTRIRGYAKKGHLRSQNISIAADSSTITLTGLSTSGWRVGDTVIILGTNYVPTVATDPQYTGPRQYWYRFEDRQARVNLMNEYQFGEDEQRRITAINGSTITLDAPLVYSHAGMEGTLKDGKRITVRPVIANVSRSIRFRTATAEEDGHLDSYADISILQRRAHFMVMRQPDTDMRYFETKNMGRTSTDPSLFVAGLPYQVERAGGIVTVNPLRDNDGGAFLADPNNVRGRYPIHLHWCGGPYNASPMVPLIGATAWAPIGGPPIPGWGITQHGTRAAIEDCVISNVRGGGMVSEIGNETGQWANNVVTGVRGDGDSAGWGTRSEHFTNHNGSVGVAYENQSRAIMMTGNIAGSSKYAFLWLAQKDNKWFRSPRHEDLRLADPLSKGAAGAVEYWQDETMGHITPQIPPFHDNEAHACMVGFAVIHRLAGSTILMQGDKTPMLMERFHCLNVKVCWDVPQYSNTYYVRDCLFQGPPPLLDGSKGFRLGDVTWDWNISNCHLRNFGIGIQEVGAGLNYEGNLIDITMENVTTPVSSQYRYFTGASNHATKNVMGDWQDHPTDPNRAIIRQFRILDSATELPTPYPLEPYGRKLPANRPDGTPYPAVRPGDRPYFVLGDGTNGEATTTPIAINLTLNAGRGRNQGRLHGIVRDSVGDRRYPDWQSSETYPANVSIKSHRTLGKLTPEQLVQWHGCWQDGSTWKVRTWFPIADRFTLVRSAFYVDWTLAGFPADFLELHNIGTPATSYVWPDQLEAVPAQRALTPITRSLRFLSRTYLEAVSGQPLAHRLRPNAVQARFQIVGGMDAARFAISGQNLTWANNGTRSLASPADADGNNIYEVNIRATDEWGNTVDQAHRVVVISSDRISAQITDNFDRADGNLSDTPGYQILAGPPEHIFIRSNVVGTVANTTQTTLDMGSLGTSEQEIAVNFTGFSRAAVIFRMVDENNYLSFRRADDFAALVIEMRIDGVWSEVCRYPTTNTVIVRCQGDHLIVTERGTGNVEPKVRYPINYNNGLVSLVDLDPLAEPGSVLLPANAPRGTKIGLRSSNTGASSWIDNLTAKALPG